MKQATKRFVSFVLGIVFVVGTFVVYFNFIRPAYEDLQITKGELVKNEKITKAQQDAIGDVGELLKNTSGEDAESILKALSLALPPRIDLAGALVQISGIIRENNMVLTSLGFSVAAQRKITSPRGDGDSSAGSLVKPAGTVRIQAAFSGSYEDFKTLIRDLETNIRIFDVENVGFTPRLIRIKTAAPTSTRGAATSTPPLPPIDGAGASAADLEALEAFALETEVVEPKAKSAPLTYNFSLSVITYYQSL